MSGDLNPQRIQGAWCKGAQVSSRRDMCCLVFCGISVGNAISLINDALLHPFASCLLPPGCIMQSNGVGDGTDDLETAEAEGPLTTEHIQ